MRHAYSPDYPGMVSGPPEPGQTPSGTEQPAAGWAQPPGWGQAGPGQVQAGASPYVAEEVSGPVFPGQSPGAWLARADLVANGSFEEWDDGVPSGWDGTNVWPEEAKIHTGRSAVRLGSPSEPGAHATLAQVMQVVTGTVYQLTFSALGTGDVPRPVEVIWLDVKGQPLGEAGPPMLLPPVVLPQFAQYSRVIGPAPVATRFVQVRFSKTGSGYLVLDDVSLFRLY